MRAIISTPFVSWAYACKRRRFKPSWVSALHALDPVLERDHLLLHDLQGGLIGQFASGIKFGVRVVDEDFWFGQGKNPQRSKAAPPSGPMVADKIARGL